MIVASNMSAVIVWADPSAWSDYADLMADASFAASSNYNLQGGGIDPWAVGGSSTIGTVFCDYGCDASELAVTDEMACDATVSGCLLPMTHADSAFIASIHKDFVDPSTITDPKRQRACKLMEGAFEALRAGGRIYRGSSLIGDGPLIHDAETYPVPNKLYAGATFPVKGQGASKVHVDGDTWDKAEADTVFLAPAVAGALLHEAAHAKGFKHPGEDKEPYTAWPFLYVNSQDMDTDQSCIKSH